MEPLKIAVVDDNEGIVGNVAEAIESSGGCLSGLKIECSTHVNAENNIIDSKKILADNPDLVILDYNLGWGINGLRIAEEIREQKSNLPVIIMSGAVLKADRSKIRKAQKKGRINDYLEKPFEGIGEIREAVRENIRRPLNVGLVGLSEFGTGFLKELGRNSNAGKVQVYSGSRLGDYPDMRELEWVSNAPKIKLIEDLESALDGTDCVLICTSAKRGKNTEKIAQSSDRLDLFEQEYKKNVELSKAIKKSGYPGLVMYFTNPIGPLLEQSRRIGIPTGQLTSPFSLDEARIMLYLRNNLEEATYNKLKKRISVAGQHGAPYVCFPRDTPKNAIEIIRAAEKAARKTPGDSMIAHGKLGIEPETQRFYGKFINDLAGFRARTPHAAYCYCEFGDQKGFIAVPHKVNYFPYLRVEPDQERIRLLGEDLKNTTFVDILAKQKELVDKHSN